MTISRVSNSLENFLVRGLNCFEKRIEQDIHSPSSEALEIINRLDGDNVLPNPSAVYKIEDMDSGHRIGWI